jgi:hypothetical protein
MAWLPYFDESFSPITDDKAAYAAGFRVLAGYAGGGSVGKWLTKARAAAWLAQGEEADIAALFEAEPGRALTAGRAGGRIDAQSADKAWTALGYSLDGIISWAVDRDVTANQISGPVADYALGWHDVIGLRSYPYIENDGIDYLYGRGLTGGGFQPAAWAWGSPAKVDAWATHAGWHQEHNGINEFGGNIDIGHILDTLPMWRNDVALSDSDIAKVAAATAALLTKDMPYLQAVADKVQDRDNGLIVNVPDGPDYPGNKTISLASALNTLLKRK